MSKKEIYTKNQINDLCRKVLRSALREVGINQPWGAVLPMTEEGERARILLLKWAHSKEIEDMDWVRGMKEGDTSE